RRVLFRSEYCLAVFSLVNLQAQQAAKGAGIAHRLDLNAHALLPQALGIGKQRRHGIVRWCGLVLGRVALTARRVAARLAAPWAFGLLAGGIAHAHRPADAVAREVHYTDLD